MSHLPGTNRENKKREKKTQKLLDLVTRGSLDDRAEKENAGLKEMVLWSEQHEYLPTLCSMTIILIFKETIFLLTPFPFQLSLFVFVSFCFVDETKAGRHDQNLDIIYQQKQEYKKNKNILTVILLLLQKNWFPLNSIYHVNT